MLILSADDVRTALPMEPTIQAMKRAYAALSDGRAVVPLRARLPVDMHEGVTLFMPAYVEEEKNEALAVKIVSVFPNNAELDLPIIHAAVVVMEAQTGEPVALLEGGSLTAIRTGAGGGAAVDLLAREDCKVAAIFGAGVQSRTQLEAVCTVRPIETVWVYDPSTAKAEQFAFELAGYGPIPTDLRVASSPAEAVANADVVCAATTSTTPVFDDADLKTGTHVTAVGSYTPDMQEIPPETVQRALVVVDSRTAVLAESGDLIQPIQAGLFTDSHIHAELGEIVLGRVPGRTSPEQITYFKSVGVAVQDAAAARLALQNARDMDLGHAVDW